MKTKGSFGKVLKYRLAAFTLTEIMTAMAIFSLVVVDVVYSHILGLKMFNITATKLSASASARAALNHVRDDIRSAKLLYVGTGDSLSFSHVSGDNPRQGNALQVYPTRTTNVFVRYYVDDDKGALMRLHSGSTQATVIAPYITNLVAFRAEDFAGNTLTNDQNNRVIKMTLEFYQWEFPIARVGDYYDYFRLQTKVTRRTIE